MAIAGITTNNVGTECIKQNNTNNVSKRSHKFKSKWGERKRIRQRLSELGTKQNSSVFNIEYEAIKNNEKKKYCVTTIQEKAIVV